MRKGLRARRSAPKPSILLEMFPKKSFELLLSRAAGSALQLALEQCDLHPAIGCTAFPRFIALHFLAGAQTKNKHPEQWDLMLLRQVTNDTLGTFLAQPEVMTVIPCFVRETLDL